MKKITRLLCNLGIALLILNSSVSGVALLSMPSYIHAEEVTGVGEAKTDVNVRSGPGKENDTIGKLKEGDIVTILGEESGWYKIEYDEGIGYVSADYVILSESDDVENESESEEELTTEEEEGNSEIYNPSFWDLYKQYIIIAGLGVLALIFVVGTILAIRRIDDDDYDDDDYDDYDDYEDDYDEDYDDDYEDDYDDRPRRRQRAPRYDEEEVSRRNVRQQPRNPQYNQRQMAPQMQQPRNPQYDQRQMAPQPGMQQPRNPQYDQRQMAPQPGMQQPRNPQYDQRQMAPQPGVQNDRPDPVRYMSNNPDDYRIDIDPKFFETTSLPVIDDVDAPTPLERQGRAQENSGAAKAGREAELEEAMNKINELQKEIERIKSES